MKAKKTITQCPSCERDTNHSILFQKKSKVERDFEPNQYDILDYLTIECAGCKGISFLLRELVEDPENEGKFFVFDTTYPNRNEEFEKYDFLHFYDTDELPIKIKVLYDEVVNAFKAESNILAGIGLRTIVEAICVQQNIKGKSLQEMIKKLNENGLISNAELPILDKLRLIGNQSTHQIKAIPLDKLNYALGIINHVMKSIYILPKINRRLKF